MQGQSAFSKQSPKSRTQLIIAAFTASNEERNNVFKLYLVVLVTILGADLDNLIGSLGPCSDIAGEE